MREITTDYRALITGELLSDDPKKEARYLGVTDSFKHRFMTTSGSHSFEMLINPGIGRPQGIELAGVVYDLRLREGQLYIRRAVNGE